MTSGPALPCPKCRRTLDPLSWHDAGHGSCGSCKVDFEFTAFPALTATTVRAVPKAVLVADHATCFFHSENQAETLCESCGRFLCSVCAVDFAGRRLCSSCIAAAKAGDNRSISRRTLYDGIALGLTLVPLLIWFVTVLTAPIALGFVVVGWRKPGSLVGRGGKTKLIISGLLALIQIAGWIAVGIFLFTRKK